MATSKDPDQSISSEQAQKVLMSLFTISRLLRPSGIRNLATKGDPPAPRHVIALFHLATKGPMSVGELANTLGVTLTTASLSVTQMAAANLVIRSEDPLDHRRTIVSISSKLQPIVEEVLTTKLQTLHRALAVLGPKRSENLVKDLDLLLQTLESENDFDAEAPAPTKAQRTKHCRRQ